MNTYGDCHIIFVQYMMQHRIVSQDKIHVKMKQFCDFYKTEFKISMMESFLETVNDGINPFNKEIKLVRKEKDGSFYYVLYQMLPDRNRSLLSKTFSVAETEYFKKFLEHLVSRNNQTPGSISSVFALNINLELKNKMSKVSINQFLEDLIQKNYLEVNHGCYSLSTKSIFELEHFLLNHFSDDIKICKSCNKLVLSGVDCTKCKDRFHNYCITEYMNILTNENIKLKCQSCECEWDTEMVFKIKSLSLLMYKESSSSQSCQSENQRKRKA